ncbi:hypothetical protein [uncultured Robinsoniella sp.]|uniref:hypothetical protein n=1 Tax=uncultured Robinsoniella sp. TaxID=904190 RepID=UPI00374E2DC9
MDVEKVKVCLECGSKFQTNDNRVKYCSDECRRSSALNKVKKCQKVKEKKSNITKTCCICGKDFVDTTINHCKNTCSEECRREKWRMNWEKWKTENPESYKQSQKKSILRKEKIGYWKKYRIKKRLKTIKKN